MGAVASGSSYAGVVESCETEIPEELSEEGGDDSDEHSPKGGAHAAHDGGSKYNLYSSLEGSASSGKSGARYHRS